MYAPGMMVESMQFHGCGIALVYLSLVTHKKVWLALRLSVQYMHSKSQSQVFTHDAANSLDKLLSLHQNKTIQMMIQEDGNADTIL